MKKTILKDFDLNGKVAAITAGGGDLCGCMAEALGAMGVKVAALDIDLKKAEARSSAVTRSGGTAKAFQCDVLDRDQVRECYEAVCRSWGSPDFLINGAGGNAPRATTSQEFHISAGSSDPTAQSFFDLDPEGFRQVFDLNFMGTFLVSQVFSQGMVNKG
jgi:NAD(P)-dependent dehydrogenase (short-subunit alcohol dehydrogenase family)